MGTAPSGSFVADGDLQITPATLGSADEMRMKGNARKGTDRGGDAGTCRVRLGEELPHQGAPPSLVTVADEYGLPLLLLPGPIPFIAVVKWVFARGTSGMSVGLGSL